MMAPLLKAGAPWHRRNNSSEVDLQNTVLCASLTSPELLSEDWETNTVATGQNCCFLFLLRLTAAERDKKGILPYSHHLTDRALPLLRGISGLTAGNNLPLPTASVVSFAGSIPL